MSTEHPEAEVYRKALIDLLVTATSGGRKTMDNSEIERRASAALDRGSAIFQREHAACSHVRGTCEVRSEVTR